MFAAQDAFGVVCLGGLFGAGEIDVGTDLGGEAPGAHQWLQHAADTLYQRILVTARVIELLTGDNQIALVVLAREQIAALIDNGDIFRSQLRHAGGDQIGDGVDLRIAEITAAHQGKKHRRRWLTTTAHKNGTLRCRQMHTRGLHVAEPHDRALQFALLTAFVTIGFHELTGAQTLFEIESLIAITRLTGDTRCRHLQAQRGDLSGGHEDDTGGGIDAIFAATGLQHFDQLIHVIAIHVGIKRLILFPARP